MLIKLRNFVFLACFVFAACDGSSKENLLLKAKEQQDAKNHRGAIVLLKSLLEKDPDDQVARYLLANSYLQLGKYEIAETEFQKLTGAFPDLPLKLASLYNRTDRSQRAIAALNKYLVFYPGSIEARQLLAEGLLSLGELDAAEASYRAALRAMPGKTELVLGLVGVLLRNRKIAEVQALIEPLLQREPGNATAHLYLGRLENMRGNRNGALQQFLQVVELDAENVPALYMIGLLRLEKGELAEAERLGRLLREKFPEQTLGYQLLGFVGCVKGDYEEAVLQLQMVAGTSPDPLTAYMLGMSYYKLGQLELAVNQIQKVLDCRPQASQPRLILAAILLQQERVDDAVSEIKRVLREEEKNALAHSTLGSAYLKKGLFDQAMAEFERAMEIDPKLLEAHYRKGLFKENRGELSESEEEIIAELAIAPEIPDLRLLLAQNYLRQNKYSDAVRTLKEGMTGKETDAVLYNFLAIAYFADRKNDQGIASLQKAKELKPDYLTPYYNLAAFYVRQHDYGNGRREYEAILGRQPDEFRAMLLMALTAELSGTEKAAEAWYRKARQSGIPAGFLAFAHYLQRTGNPGEALQVLDELVAKEPRNIVPRELKGKILLASGEYAAAAEAFASLEPIDPLRGSLFLAETYLRQGDIAKAGETARRLIDESPQDAAGYLALAAVLAEEGKTTEAVKLLQAVSSRLTDNGLLRMRLAELHEANGDHPAAFAIYSRLLHEKENYYPALYATGALYEKLREKERAIEYYRQTLLQQADFPPALTRLAYLYADAPGRGEKALELALRAYRIQPENQQTIATLGFIFYCNGRHDEACRMLEKAAVLLPEDPSVHYHLALAYEQLGKHTESVRALRRAIEFGPFPEAANAKTLLEKMSTMHSTGKI